MRQVTYYQQCPACRSPQPHDARGCIRCRRRTRAARRVEKGIRIGSRRPSALARGQLEKVADDMYSIALRAAHAAGLATGWRAPGGPQFPAGCEMCGGRDCGAVPGRPELLQCAHGISRGAKSIRYHPENTFALGARCHFLNSSRPVYGRADADIGRRWLDWCERVVGDRWTFVLAAQRGGHGADHRLVVLEAAAKIRALQDPLCRTWATQAAASVRNLAAVIPWP